MASLAIDAIAVDYWVVAAFALFLKMFANSSVQGVVRIRNRAFVRPEDAAFFGAVTPRERELPLVERAQLCWRNDLENIPIFLFLSLALVLAGGSARWVGIYCAVFFVARVFHTVFYLRPRQPHRNLAFQVGLAATFATGIHAVALL